ncbi:putative DNA mismatch repair protein Mlh1 [Triangularia verruculosa]|uniref:DNA mismatch repair protein Mlh1 n=1 Tax=Triangularia verruculosa TaxID=2587418 RepID=A0AAN6XG90_9PEZI|nr:putative DNA mismatch repair protein Mlh1 [Triangularia verruculosa]
MSDAMEVDSEVDGPRGAKRKADVLDDNTPQRRIKPLDEDVINKIAAGEIIVAPVNALKELMENSVDAGSTTVDVSVKEGGLKLLQITDNGSGIEKEDLPILCKRFTTSKLQKFEDLQTIATYGFRGEALASISHIAHLTVTTKTTDSECAWRAHYGNGVLVPAKPGQSPDPKPVSGRQGTQITVEDLFFNVPTRRRAFRSPANEYNKILDMVGRYAIHCAGVGFTCKKHGESSKGISVSPSASCLDRIRQIYGASVANELTEFETEDDQWGFKAKGLATNANYSTKKTTLLLFINNRCVESTNIRKAIEQTYASFLPKNGHPFVYLSLEIDPRRVDVNVHPTKQEVNFLNEDETIQAVCEHLRSKLAEVDASRTFLTQTLLPPGTTRTASASSTQPPPTPAPGGPSSRRAAPRSDTSLVRTDTNLRKITSMLPPARAAPSHPNTEPTTFETAPSPRQPTSCHLHSIKELRAQVREDMHGELTDIFANHTFVGVVDPRRRLAAIQAGVKLYMIDYGRVCYEYFYQLGLTDFGNFGTIQFQPPLSLRALLASSPDFLTEYDDDDDEDDADDTDIDPEEKSEIIEAVVEKLVERREMLLEYFSLEVSPAGELCSIPLLVNGYEPPLTKLPGFLVRLGPCVDWTEEKACFESFLKELAGFYVPERLPPKKATKEEGEGDGMVDSADEREEDARGEEEKRIDRRRRDLTWALEHVLFPAFKARLVGTKSIMEAGGVVEVADLKGLYRVFERC